MKNGIIVDNLDCACLGIPQESLDEYFKKGYLTAAGLCKFPKDAVAYPSGIYTKGLNVDVLNQMTEAQIREGIDKGWIMFKDGNAEPHTLKEYCELYPDYPNPEWLMRLEGRFPPKGVIKVGGRK